MNLRDLHYFITTAEELHFARAAELCHVSQSTLSIQIKKLEDTLGVALFERNGKTVMLTDVGAQLVFKARAVLEAVQEMKALARVHTDPFSGELRLGAFPSLAPYFFPLIIGALAELLPQLRVVLIEEKTDELVKRLGEGSVDAVLIALPHEVAKCTAVVLYDEPFLLAVARSHPLAKKKTVAFEDMLQEKMLLLDEGHCLRAQALTVCANIGVGEASSYRATSLETLRNMVATGAGVTFMPKLAVRERDPLVAYIPFENPGPSRTIGLMFRHSDPRTVLYNRLVEIMRGNFK